MKILILSLIIIQSSFATIYFAAFDKVTNSWGLAYSSSGPGFPIRLVKDKGIIGFGSYGKCAGIDERRMFKENLSAKQITSEIYSSCQKKGWEKFRMTAVTSDGSLSSVIAKKGCHRVNRKCGEIVTDDLVLTAGGLRKGVHEKTVAYYQSIKNKSMVLECKLLKTLRYMYRIGGEILTFNGAAILVDSKDRDTASHFWITRNKNQKENFLLTHLRNQMWVKGMKCD